MIRTVSIWRWQLVFTASIVAIVVMVAGFKPQTLAIPLFIGGSASSWSPPWWRSWCPGGACRARR